MRTSEELLRAVYDMEPTNRAFKAYQRIVNTLYVMKYNQEQMVADLHKNGYHPEADFVKTWTPDEWEAFVKEGND